MKIYILDYVSQCQTNDDGEKIFNIIYPYIKRHKDITLSFKGVTSIPSSFVNSAFIALLDYAPFDDIKRHLKFSDTNSQMNSMIKERFSFEIKKHKT
ncbi:MAG: STAS-like domain-containing protein, partial [Advenella sp.]|uniref:STAS-like domain-containing protein n=1 Tax=Advenella sp. TaxID=1872388 RepID=UPI00258BB696